MKVHESAPQKYRRKKGENMKAAIASVIVLTALIYAPESSASVTAQCKGVSFWATATADGQRKIKVSGGSGILSNEGNVVVAQGDLNSAENFMTVKGSKDASFVHAPGGDAFAPNVFSNDPVEHFAEVELGPENRWTLKDENFLFILDVPDMNQPRVEVALDESLARASSIKLQQGIYKLWGYTITVEKATGTVKFAHGRIVDSSDATFK